MDLLPQRCNDLNEVQTLDVVEIDSSDQERVSDTKDVAAERGNNGDSCYHPPVRSCSSGVGVSRDLNETPPGGSDDASPLSPGAEENLWTSDSSTDSSTPPPSQKSRLRKRKLVKESDGSESSDDNDCSSKKSHSEREKTDGRKGKLLDKEHPPPHVQDWLQLFATWPKPEQNLALHRLLTTECDSNQLRLGRTAIEPYFQRDFISLLPKEVSQCTDK